MGDKSMIEWTEATWNPVTGCTKVSQGCKNCYAERVFPRAYGVHVKDATPRKFTEVRCHPDRLDQPLRWRRARRIFVNSMSDLFHEDVPDQFIRDVFERMCRASHHHFQVLTKRPERMRQCRAGVAVLPNVWLGVSVEDQKTLMERLPHLMATPAAVRFVSYEPALGPVNFAPWLKPVSCVSPDPHGRDQRIDWIIAGGESGPRARPSHPDWFRAVRDQCQAAGVPFFFKQWGEYTPNGRGPVWRWIKADELASDGLWAKDAPGVIPVWRVGKKAAGRLLDGCEYSEYPA